MLLSRKNTLNIQSLRKQLASLTPSENYQETEALIEELSDYVRLYQVYEAALNEVATKLENLDNEFQVNYNHNPIHHIESRLKSFESLVNKARRFQVKLSIPNLKREILDIAGIRVITNYVEDIYQLEKLLLQQHDISLLKRKDYIKSPKASGYRSLHIVVSVPVFLSTGVNYMPVEIQIRTISMDMWASLEHKLRYKNDGNEKVAQYEDELQTISERLFAIDQEMQTIYHAIS
ncbi:GTP pyrophosphokinase [Eremococcus coleocola]|uniref:RelA/SpoT domain protein n=1 Tax=Eremococcus coleocola ACS-139-V-Col8 TaxID=908337 RepID=E4KMT2_9LACT|nr:GTP pyrophosphokinase family protein [Eremococcus coleocola]EFR31653.1 RelA/SpoT domain protein [Eremococcus coleocola ACS-139-V-Col8]